ncbi:ATP-grasp domain-containing protein [Xanthomonas arboricola]|uniref:ATP-grasp domain-containing protein n=1 Tax=Xanthomonas arboricola TaxID=56448 RepID=UPI000E0F7672|nr:ATP-grasp domain-containing protein [Xanthomonas arboricola]
MKDGILVTSIGSMSAVSVLGALRTCTSARIVGSDIHPGNWVAASALVDHFVALPPGQAADAYADALLTVCLREQIGLVMPLTDPEVDVLVTHRLRFASHGVIVCTAEADAVALARDKLALHARFVDDVRVATIPSVPLDQTADLPAFPLLAKPRRGRSSQGHRVLHDAEDLASARRRLDPADYLLQPYYPGAVFVADVVREQASGAGRCLCREELLRTANGAGTTVRVAAMPELEALALHVAAVLDLNGCSNIEFLRHDDRYLLMDVNPRFSAGVGFSVLAGYDMPSAHLACFTGRPLPPMPSIAQPRVFTRHAHEVELCADRISAPVSIHALS